jgi:hypothetical protein
MTFIINLFTKLAATFALRWLPVVRAAVANPRVIILALAGSLALAVTVEQARIAAVRRHAFVAALEVSNLAAQRDSTRNAAIDNQRVAHVLGDSLKVAEIRVVQVTQHLDALDKALGRERVARYVDNITVDSLRRVMRALRTGPHPSDSGASARFDQAGETVRSAFFDIRQEPYTIAAQVDIPAPPDPARLELHVAIDPIPIEARVSCSGPNGQGIKTASVSASSPTWATVRFGRVEQSPEVCGSPALRSGKSHRGLFSRRLVIGVGRALTPNGWRWAMFAGAGIGIEL